MCLVDATKREQEEKRLSEFLCPNADAREGMPVGVLLSDEIQHYVATCRLIDPFKEESLKPAGYELRVGDEYVLGGERKELKRNAEIRIPPFNVVVVKTEETINLPRFLIARWNIRVKWAYDGLLWVGGPQVDPGWVGHLFCPIYNLSDKQVVLRAGDPIALMDFVTTTPFNLGRTKEYRRPPNRVLLEEYGAEELKSALYTEAKTRIDKIEIDTRNRIEKVEIDTRNRIDQIEKRAEFFIGSIWVVITILLGVLSVFATIEKPTLVPVWPNISLVISIGALALAFLAFRRCRSSK